MRWMLEVEPVRQQRWMGSIGDAIAGAHRRGLSHTTMHHLRWGFTQKRVGKVGILTGRFSAIKGSILGHSTMA
jgi:hypothetical protein